MCFGEGFPFFGLNRGKNFVSFERNLEMEAGYLIEIPSEETQTSGSFSNVNAQGVILAELYVCFSALSNS